MYNQGNLKIYVLYHMYYLL